MTLRALAKRMGYTASALSRIENERLGMTYEKLIRLSSALQVDLNGFLNDVGHPRESHSAPGRRSITRKDRGDKIATRNSQYRSQAPDLRGKRMVPMVGRLTSTSLEHFGPLIRHSGEEWVYVLKGEVEVHSSFYEPERLREGDSIYLDSSMEHAYLSVGNTAAEIIAVYCGHEDELPAEIKPPRRRLRSTR